MTAIEFVFLTPILFFMIFATVQFALYFFAGDERSGDINGQGVNGTWFAVAPDGGRTRPFPNSVPPGR